MEKKMILVKVPIFDDYVYVIFKFQIDGTNPIKHIFQTSNLRIKVFLPHLEIFLKKYFLERG